MQKQPWFHALISLIGSIGLFVLSLGCDRFLFQRQKLASASFEYNSLFLAQIVVGLLMFIGWTALGWFILFSRPPGRPLSIGLLILGAFVVWAPYVGMWAGLPIVRLSMNYLTSDLVHASGIFIAVLGGLGLLQRLSRSTNGVI